jgi:hypothetical protein
VHVVSGSLFSNLTVPSSFCCFMSNLVSVTIPGNITGIGGTFLADCTSFNQVLDLPSSLTSIGGGFLSGCVSFNQPLVLPDGITLISNNFLDGCTSFNQSLTIPDFVQTIPTQFLYGCSSFNSPLVLPSSLTSIGDRFMFGCSAFGYPLSLPSSLTSVGSAFMLSCGMFLGPLAVGSLSPSVFGASDHTLSVMFSSDLAYMSGVRIGGAGALAFKARFPDIAGTNGFYRRLLAPSDQSFTFYFDGVPNGFGVELETYSETYGQRSWSMSFPISPVDARIASDCTRIDLKLTPAPGASDISFVFGQFEFDSFNVSQQEMCTVAAYDQGRGLYVTFDGYSGGFFSNAVADVTVNGVSINNINFRVYYV